MWAQGSDTEEGYSVPVQLHPHTEALAALLVPDAREGALHDASRGRDVHTVGPSTEHKRHGAPRPDGSAGPSPVWVSPPSLLSLRDQVKQLQQQKRSKQRQQVTLDANPDHFDVPVLNEGRSEARVYELVGAELAAPPMAPPSLRDDGVLVPLRMMASLVITDGSAVSVTVEGMIQAAREHAALSDMRGGTPSVETTLSSQQCSEPLAALDAPSFGMLEDDAQQERQGPSGAHPSRTPQRESILVHTPAVSMSVSAPLPAEHGAVEFQAVQGHDALHLHDQHPRTEQQGQQATPPPEEQQALSLQQGYGGEGSPATGATVLPEDDGDAAMLIDVGSADRAAEGALLPTPDRPRALGPASGWDALRGLGLGQTSAAAELAARGGGVAATLALLPPGPPAATLSGSHDDAMQVAAQGSPPEIGAVALTDRAEPAAARASPEQVAQQRQGAHKEPESPLAGRAAARSAGPADADDGFDADDEGETAQRMERVRAALRLSAGRSTKFRPLPGLTAVPPWAYIPFARPAAEGGRQGLACLSDLATALTGTLSSPADTPQEQPSQPDILAGLGAGIMPMSMHGPGVDANPVPALAELLKLKCSLRRAMQNDNVHSMGIILSLLAALPATPALLADSQAAALVLPLQQHEHSQVAAAARHVIARWKGVLKAAARQPVALGSHSSAAANYAHGPRPSDAAPGNSCDWDVPIRDQTQLQQRPSSGLQPPGRHLRLLNIARSQSDVLADGLAAAADAAVAGAAVEQQLAAAAYQRQPRRGALESFALGRALGGLPFGGEGSGTRGKTQVERDSPSGSRTVTEGEPAGRSSAEDTHEDGVAGVSTTLSAPALDAAEAGRQGLEGLDIGGGSGIGAHVRATRVHASTAACGIDADSASGGVLGSPPSPLRLVSTPGVSPLVRDPAAVLATPVPTCPGALSSPGTALHAPDAEVSSGRVKDACGSFAVAPPSSSSWRPMPVVTPGCVLALPDLAGPPDVLSLRSPPSTAVGPATPAALILVPPPLAQPSSRKRKVERERASSRRRGPNPSKRAAAASGSGQFTAPRPVHAPLPVGPVAETAGSLSDDQRQPLPSPHGPVTGLKTPARSSLLGLHAPHSKRPRHHAGGAAGQHTGAPHHTATQVRRVSLLLSSLDLGIGASANGSPGEGGPEGRSEKARVAMEGDADADADMGSQDDGVAMLTSDEDSPPAGNGGSGVGVGAGHLDDNDSAGGAGGGGGSGSGGRRDAGLLQRLPSGGAKKTAVSGATLAASEEREGNGADEGGGQAAGDTGEALASVAERRRKGGLTASASGAAFASPIAVMPSSTDGATGVALGGPPSTGPKSNSCGPVSQERMQAVPNMFEAGSAQTIGPRTGEGGHPARGLMFGPQWPSGATNDAAALNALADCGTGMSSKTAGVDAGDAALP